MAWISSRNARFSSRNWEIALHWRINAVPVTKRMPAATKVATRLRELVPIGFNDCCRFGSKEPDPLTEVHPWAHAKPSLAFVRSQTKSAASGAVGQCQAVAPPPDFSLAPAAG